MKRARTSKKKALKADVSVSSDENETETNEQLDTAALEASHKKAERTKHIWLDTGGEPFPGMSAQQTESTTGETLIDKASLAKEKKDSKASLPRIDRSNLAAMEANSLTEVRPALWRVVGIQGRRST
ncbi:MAG: hypothetical protein M1836_001545 [Candelina mexicana]|nr:MAG: hypothetical protein M1836_001545 [Candelina mexicana]